MNYNFVKTALSSEMIRAPWSFFSDTRHMCTIVLQCPSEGPCLHCRSYGGHDHRPQLTYPFGAVVFAKVSRSSKKEVDAKYARGVYLGPVLGSTGHQVRIRLDSGETKLIVAPGLKLLYPLRYDASLLDGAKALEGFVPPLDEGAIPGAPPSLCAGRGTFKRMGSRTRWHTEVPRLLWGDNVHFYAGFVFEVIGLSCWGQAASMLAWARLRDRIMLLMSFFPC